MLPRSARSSLTEIAPFSTRCGTCPRCVAHCWRQSSCTTLFPRLLARRGEMVFDESAYRSAHPVGWVSGAAMFVRRSALDRVGLLDESFFLFSEEIDSFKRMNDAGLPVWFVPDAVVVHRHDKRAPNPELVAIDIDSRRLYWRKHASACSSAAAMAFLGLGMVLRYVAWSLLALGGREGATAERAAYGRGLRALTPNGRPSRPTPPGVGPRGPIVREWR